ncbi:hypothetical protein H9Y04_05175 [Streptomyces sp. TRM66268-LWL]|uniref:Uncharacterized protein n=1 Tax=Streptomyces polyasparticus TaxID=2767826 RepID=A0ABR7S909_9ACTN|nr:hypothetical protein [Streptomyces polyasparticus]MBC9711960.1 hypothetical protein [Streptomyces polyasparticus]
MGASGWEYVTPYEGSVEASLAALHARVFAEDYGADDTYETLDDLWDDEEFMGEEGTHSILDIQRVVYTSAPPESSNFVDYGTLRPIKPDRVRHHFGTERPTPAQFESLLAEARASSRQPRSGDSLLAEPHMRWTGLYVLLYEADGAPEPSHVGIFGYSGD